MILQIPYPIARQIADHAQENYPDEVCGLLAGIDNHIHLAIPVNNVAKTPQTQYRMDPGGQIRALKTIEKEQLIWIGIYHSHPKSAPIPSSIDIEAVIDYKPVHLIVSLQDSKPKFKVWNIQETTVTPVDLIFDTQSPDHSAHEPLSNTQKAAIILTAFICVMLMLAISFSLLPPAPEITPIP